MVYHAGLGAFAHPANRASNRVLVKCGLPLLRDEPRLDRNFYKITQARWQRLALGATPMLPHA